MVVRLMTPTGWTLVGVFFLGVHGQGKASR
jgi:hypothetical protein